MFFVGVCLTEIIDIILPKYSWKMHHHLYSILHGLIMTDMAAPCLIIQNQVFLWISSSNQEEEEKTLSSLINKVNRMNYKDDIFEILLLTWILILPRMQLLIQHLLRILDLQSGLLLEYPFYLDYILCWSLFD
jgi:hypothetical protein